MFSADPEQPHLIPSHIGLAAAISAPPYRPFHQAPGLLLRSRGVPHYQLPTVLAPFVRADARLLLSRLKCALAKILDFNPLGMNTYIKMGEGYYLSTEPPQSQCSQLTPLDRYSCAIARNNSPGMILLYKRWGRGASRNLSGLNQ
jgi:hypothetical protein